MNQPRTRKTLCIAFLGACLMAAAATANGTAATEKSAEGEDVVTVTLLRWPYT